MGLFLSRDPALLAEARATFERQGHGALTPLMLPGWHGFHAAYGAGGPDTLLVEGDDWVAVAGTMTFDGQAGRAALAALLREGTFPAIDWSRLAGEFVMLVRRRGHTFMCGDHLGLFQLFVAEGLFSTSLMAIVGALPRVRFDPQGVYEWAFDVTALGDATVFDEVRLLPPDRLVELTPDGTLTHALAKPLPNSDDRSSAAERLDRHRQRLGEAVTPHVAAHRDRIRCPLSGGLDSRLLLAVLRAAGSAPEVYVYGPPDSEDVAVARGIGEALNFPIEWIEKGREPIDPDAFPAMVARNFDAFDALPTFGNIFDNGGHLAARERRHADGWLAASGGAGEVYRDFFYLPDRPIAAEAVARSFFARFAPGDATALFDPDAFVRAIADKMLAALGMSGHRGPLPRWAVDQLYPRFRCRALFGREISLEARQGPWLAPFLDHRLVAEAAALPQPERVAGRFEAALLHAIDPVLAAQPSAYGHHFAGPPSVRHRLGEWSTRIRPVRLRQHSYAVKRRLRAEGDEHGGELGSDHMGRVIDLAFPAMRRFFNVDRINDSGLWRRIACLEYLATRLGAKLLA